MSESLRASRFERPVAGPRPADRRIWILLGFTPVVLFASAFVYGMTARGPALVLVAVAGIGVLVALSNSANRARLARVPLLREGALFAVVIGLAIWSLTPWPPGGVDPIWDMVVGRGAGTLNTSDTRMEIVKLLGLACVYVLGCLHGLGRDHFRTTSKIVVTAGAVFAFVVVVMFLAGLEQGAFGRRLAGPFASPNVAATVFGALGILAASWAAARLAQVEGGHAAWPDRLASASIPAALALTAGLALVLTASRGGIAATLVALLLLIVWQVLKGRRKVWTTIVAVGLTLVVSALFLMGAGDLLLERINPAGLPAEYRSLLFATHWAAFQQAPWFGFGLGTFSELNRQLTTAENYRALWEVNAAHSVYLQWLEEAGIAGASAMFLCVAVPIGSLVLALFRTRDSRGWLRGLLLADIVILLHGFTDFSLQVFWVAAFFAFILGLQRAASVNAR